MICRVTGEKLKIHENLNLFSTVFQSKALKFLFDVNLFLSIFSKIQKDGSVALNLDFRLMIGWTHPSSPELQHLCSVLVVSEFVSCFCRVSSWSSASAASMFLLHVSVGSTEQVLMKPNHFLFLADPDSSFYEPDL